MPARVDGRTARAERTRRAIVDAHLALLGEGDLRPTGERIAQRAGVSLRALWTNFRDLETLFAASGQRLLERQQERFKPVPASLPLPQRIEQFCQQRARMLEIVAVGARAAQLREPFSPQLRRNRAKFIGLVRDELEELFGDELDAAGDRRGEVLNGLLVICTWAGWAMLRDELGMDVDPACGVMTQTVSALLSDYAAD